ncbi:iron ABC transporter permease [Myxococcus sp. CA051A]|uniref:Iron ABC transporter permease n=1 Tax=Myxococcus llanfairpwllgwyngyllgogerychwyrndrobwllllantysiliogogogochensis TaxID=2590453 RepID=A0A540X0V2_9BACT|nr:MULTISPECIES: iron ABC transporter permease [Myxococcus]NTX06205.1 iron ABC transporter permease [Myxococcus sp. CA040A]NTX09466.1 iron ABC transporter permease [Myxococcus sp. CA056]NTX37828.1 iron ABC transporter permease [Myxococcus sp. CA033]NTX53868.1 iron ABC transporter permease [Myxococcus sp. CA039A]NTX61115.1 iron ABC transporter permease [Myxococcus sp. CA051A]
MRTRLVVMLAVCALVVAVAPFVGPPMPPDARDFILWQLRIPRTLMALVVGGTLSLVGAVYQSLFSNPLAAPSTIGTTAGATLGALVAIVLGARTALWGLPLITGAAFAGALGVSLLVAAIAAGRNVRMNDLVLAGIAFSMAAGAISTGVQFSADSAELLTAMRWTMGHLPQVGYQNIVMLLPIAAVSVVGLLTLTRALEVFISGEEHAESQGVNVRAVRMASIGLGALGVAGCVAWCGPIAFVELIVPHIVRRVLGVSRRVLLPCSVVVGASFLVLCDAVARIILPGRETPVGLVTAALGTPLLIYLVARKSS